MRDLGPPVRLEVGPQLERLGVIGAVVPQLWTYRRQMACRTTAALPGAAHSVPTMVTNIVTIVAAVALVVFARPFASTQQTFFRRPSATARRFDVVAATVLAAAAAIWGTIDLLS